MLCWKIKFYGSNPAPILFTYVHLLNLNWITSNIFLLALLMKYSSLFYENMVGVHCIWILSADSVGVVSQSADLNSFRGSKQRVRISWLWHYIHFLSIPLSVISWSFSRHGLYLSFLVVLLITINCTVKVWHRTHVIPVYMECYVQHCILHNIEMWCHKLRFAIYLSNCGHKDCNLKTRYTLELPGLWAREASEAGSCYCSASLSPQGF